MAAGLGEVAERLRRSTVEVFVEGGRGGGSGVVSGPGRVLTNAHVARGERAKIRLWNGESFEASVERRDVHRDLATLSSPVLQAPVASLRTHEEVRTGEFVVAVGNPLGFAGALSTGVVYGVGPARGLGRQRWVQAQVRLAPGNSGGPLADAEGRVIGINTMVASGLGLAVPATDVARFLAGRTTPEIGVTVRPVPVEGRRQGLLLLEVARKGIADRASLIAGDILVGTDRGLFDGPWDLSDALASARNALHVRFLRGGRKLVRETTLDLSGARVAEAA